MIVVGNKSDSKSASPLSLSTPNETQKTKGALSFSELLHGVKDKNSKTLQKGPVVLALDAKQGDAKTILNSKEETLSSLLKNEGIEINPSATKELSSSELKQLIKDAKNYLKDQITQTDGYKKSQIKELPKTLKGLAELAKKFDINISKITVEEVQAHKVSKNISSESLVELKNNEKSEKTIDKKQNSKNTDLDTEAVDVKANTKKVSTKETQQKSQAQDLDIQQQNTKVKTEAKASTAVEASKQTPLFKAQSAPQSVTTEQTLQAREFKVAEPKTAKERADDTLKLLLRGEKALKVDGNSKLTSDFSVATARVIAPGAATEAQKSLESLLRGEAGEQSASKTDALGTLKADSFEVKLNEAKQMTKYLSQDVKQAIDNYKAPFTRVKVQLNPQKLGEVDLTVIQRGKNLHVNITSNNAAINALSMNANDLKVQLNNNGIQNASLNFNSGSSDGSQANQQQQNHRQNQQASQEYSYYDSEDQQEEILSSLEIVVPNYA